ncbi:hypothetical protein ACFL3V_05710 [Nanoarchaeota archaeon]
MIIFIFDDMTQERSHDISDIERRIDEANSGMQDAADCVIMHTDESARRIGLYIAANGLQDELNIQLKNFSLSTITSEIPCYQLHTVVPLNGDLDPMQKRMLEGMEQQYAAVMLEIDCYVEQVSLEQHAAYNDLIEEMTLLVHDSGNTDASIIYVEYPREPMFHRTELDLGRRIQGSEIASRVPNVFPIQQPTLNMMRREGVNKGASVYLIRDLSTRLPGQYAFDYFIGMLANAREAELSGKDLN